MHLNSYRAEINFTPKIMLRNKVSLSVLRGIMNTHCILKFYQNWRSKSVSRYVLAKFVFVFSLLQIVIILMNSWSDCFMTFMNI